VNPRVGPSVEAEDLYGGGLSFQGVSSSVVAPTVQRLSRRAVTHGNLTNRRAAKNLALLDTGNPSPLVDPSAAHPLHQQNQANKITDQLETSSIC
jgi:hypothetical protein